MSRWMRESPGSRSPLLGVALVFAIVANLIHNRLGVDVAIVPPVLLGLFYVMRPGTVLLCATAVFIALPAILFLKPAALWNPGNPMFFFNHWALLLAALFALAAIARTLRPRPRPSARS